MKEALFVVPEARHNELVAAAFRQRGYLDSEARLAAKFSAYASKHGIRTHNALKALHLDELFGSGGKGCVPGAEIEKLESRFEASEVWNANLKLGQAAAGEAIDACIAMADKYGIGQVCVDNAFHYLWGGGYVMDAAKRGYLAYTNCTSTLAEVVPFGGRFPTLGTNPHSWGFPTTEALGFPIVVDWATSVIAMGRVQQIAREGGSLPPNAAVDKDGEPTTDPSVAAALLPFGAHKGYGLSLINELMAALIGGSLPTIRSRGWSDSAEKYATCFYFSVIHPDAMSAGAFAAGRDCSGNVKSVVEDILGHGNESCLLPGQIEARAAALSEANGGLLFSEAEIEEFRQLAVECSLEPWDKDAFAAASQA